MDDPSEPRRPNSPGGSDRRGSRNVNDHLPWINSLTTRWRKTFFFVEHDEVFNTAVVEADRLLRQKFDPSRGTVTTFLGKYLFGRVEYRLKIENGQKKRPHGWVREIGNFSHDPSDYGGGEKGVDFVEVLDKARPVFRAIMLRLIEGETFEQIVLRFESRGRKSLDPEELQRRVDRLRIDVLNEYRRLTQ